MIIAVKEVICSLPEPYGSIYKIIVWLLKKIYDNREVNKMSIHNIITCIIASLRWPPILLHYSVILYDFIFGETPLSECNIEELE